MGRPSKEFQAFDSLTKDLLTVPKSTIHERHAEHKKRFAGESVSPGTEAQAKTEGLVLGRLRRQRCIVQTPTHNPRYRFIEPLGIGLPTVSLVGIDAKPWCAISSFTNFRKASDERSVCGSQSAVARSIAEESNWREARCASGLLLVFQDRRGRHVTCYPYDLQNVL